MGVNYYAKDRKYEPKDIISIIGLNFNLGNVVKYISRAGRKPGNSAYSDIKKAADYISFELEAINKGRYGKWYTIGSSISSSEVRDIFIKDVASDWNVTNDNLFHALVDIFTCGTKSNMETQYTYRYLKAAESALNEWLDDHFEDETMPIESPDYIRGWNDAVNTMMHITPKENKNVHKEEKEND